VKSKFKIQAFLSVILLVPILGILAPLLINFFDGLPIVLYFLCLFLTFTSVWLIFGELRTKVIKLEVLDDRILYKRYIGLGCKRIIYYRDIQGFTTLEIFHNGKVIEYLIIRTSDRDLFKLSEFYHQNYFEVKNELSSKLKYLGTENYTVLKDFKDIFK